MPNTIALSVFKEYPAAAVMLHLARGQLNLAYSLHGLQSPNPLLAETRLGVEQTDRDNPLAHGVDRARAIYDGALTSWEWEMPAELVDPVLAILRRTYLTLSSQADAAGARAAALEAANILQHALSLES